MGPKRVQKRPKIDPKTHQKNQRKNDADLQPDGVCDLVSKAGGTESAFLLNAGCYSAASGLCAYASLSCSCLLLVLLLQLRLLLPLLLLLLITSRCIGWQLLASATALLFLPISSYFLVFPPISCYFLLPAIS